MTEILPCKWELVFISKHSVFYISCSNHFKARHYIDTLFFFLGYLAFHNMIFQTRGKKTTLNFLVCCFFVCVHFIGLHL